MDFNVEAFFSTLPVMGNGMLGIFAVTLIIIASVIVLNLTTTPRENNDQNDK